MERIKNNVRATVTLLLLLTLVIFGQPSRAQSDEAQELLLNWEKLKQLKNILQDMKKGYQIVSQGYNSVKNIASGNFSLHETFLDGLMVVNPEIRKYKRVADIISYQKQIISEYKETYSRFTRSETFNTSELNYLGKVYQQLADQSLDNLEELTTIITSSKLRMSDDERLQAIDRIFEDTEDKLSFLRNFNKQASILSIQRKKEKADIASASQFFK
ncbi:MAG TPA: TerB family tellurite resistance protein [Pedobacter sp.]|jgi:hypothetical protein